MLDHIPAKFQQTIFWFEEDFDHRPYTDWFHAHWHISIYISILYLIVIFGIQRFMRDREPFDLRRPLVLWSGILSVFSIVCAVRLFQEYWMYLMDYGFKATMCDDSVGYSGVNGFWALLFIVSKLPELGDTLFIVLRKKPLIFLHYYHHITVFIYSFYSYPQIIAPGRYFITMNSAVHAVMYTYYCIRASQVIRIPSRVNICITFVQLSQMVVGCIINSLAWKYRSEGQYCATTDWNIQLALGMYFSYFLLFAHYFYTTYFVKRKRSKAASKPVSESNGVHQNGSAYTNGKASLKTE